MRKQESNKIDHYPGESSEEEFPGGDHAAGRASSRPATVACLTVRSRRRAKLALCVVSCLFVLAAAILIMPAVSSAQVSIGVSVTFAPPALPVYIQPPCPGANYIWIPGYWAWDPEFGYYWVPGTWVLAPFPGALWTPGYWAWSDGVFVWYEGYWGPEIGFYGGVDYGFGYTGFGYYGGYWRGDRFYYNRAVNNVSVTNIRTVYRRPVTGPVTGTRVSYNGGPGGITLSPTTAQIAAARQLRSRAIIAQTRNIRAARLDRRQRAIVNHGRPVVAATMKAGIFSGRGVVRASRAGAPYKAPPSVSRVRPGGHHETPHPFGTERHPRTTAPRRAAPPAVIEHRAAPRSKPSPRQRIETQPRVTAPRHEAPPAVIERHAAPRREITPPSRRMTQPRREIRPAPEQHRTIAPPPGRESGGVARPPSTHRASPQLQRETRPNGENKHEEERRE